MSIEVIPGGHCLVDHKDFEVTCPCEHKGKSTPCTEACGEWYEKQKEHYWFSVSLKTDE